MKKYLFLFIAALFASFAITASAQGTELTDKEIKEIKKDAKKSAKRYEKEGYNFVGAGTFESVLSRYMLTTSPGMLSSISQSAAITQRAQAMTSLCFLPHQIFCQDNIGKKLKGY